MTYDSMGNVRTRTDAANNLTTTDYNLLGQVIRVTEPARWTSRITNGSNAADPFTDANKSLATPTTDITLNAFGQVIKQVRSPGGGVGATVTTTQTYDFDGNLIGYTDGNQNVHQRQVDFAGRVIKETQTFNNAIQIYPLNAGFMNQTIERRYAYDADGRETRVADVYQEVHWNNDRTATFTPKQSGQETTFNAFGEVTATRHIFGDAATPIGSLADGPIIESYTYDNVGHMTSKTGSDGLVRYYYDLTGEQTRVEHLGDNTSNSALMTSAS